MNWLWYNKYMKRFLREEVCHMKKGKVFEFPKMIVLTKSNRVAAYGPENPYHCTFKACCYQGK